MPSLLRLEEDHCSFGAEHELADWDNLIPLPKGFGRSKDHTIVNSNGVAAQPTPKDYRWGGELNTPPTGYLDEQSELLYIIKETYPNATINHRSNLHIHVRVPGLRDSLADLKHLQEYVHEELPKVIDLVEPIPEGVTPPERKRERRRRVSHHTFLTGKRVKQQLNARSLSEFFEREVPRSKAGKPMWHAQPRCCVNLRQLLQTDTVEFRHFPGTLDPKELRVCLEWCYTFLRYALKNQSIETLWDHFSVRKFPTFPEYNLDHEIGYQATAAHNGLDRALIQENIQLITKGRFYGTSAYYQAAERAGVVSREHLPQSFGCRSLGKTSR